MFLAASIFLSSLFSSVFLGRPPGAPLFAAGFRTTPGKGDTDVSPPCSLFSGSSLAGFKGPDLALAARGARGPLCGAAVLVGLSSSWGSSVFMGGFWPKTGLGKRGLGSRSCEADRNLPFAPDNFDKTCFGSFSRAGGIDPGLGPGFKSWSWFTLGSEGLVPGGQGNAGLASSFGKLMGLGPTGFRNPAFTSESLVAELACGPNLGLTPVGFRNGGLGSLSGFSSGEGFTPKGGLGDPNLGTLLSPAGGLAFPWLLNKFFLAWTPEGEFCPVTLKGRLLTETSSVGLPPVLNFAMRDFTSAFPSCKHREETLAERLKSHLHNLKYYTLKVSWFEAFSVADWFTRYCNIFLPLWQNKL